MYKRKVTEIFCYDAVLQTTVEHNGNCKYSDGCFVNLIFEDLCGTNLYLNNKEVEKIEITFKGQYERELLIKSLKMVINELENNTKTFEED